MCGVLVPRAGASVPAVRPVMVGSRAAPRQARTAVPREEPPTEKGFNGKVVRCQVRCLDQCVVLVAAVAPVYPRTKRPWDHGDTFMTPLEHLRAAMAAVDAFY